MLFTGIPVNAQTFQEVVDSLKFQITNTKEANEKIDLLNEIAYTNRRISGDSTLKYAQLAFREAVKVQYIKGQSIAQKNMGIAHYKLSSPKDSMVYHYKKAIGLAEKINDYYTQAACNNNIALLYGYRKNPFIAMKHYLRGIEIFDKHIKKEKSLKALMLANVAQFQWTIDNYEKALTYIERSFDIARRNKYSIILTNYSDEYSRILTRLGKYQEAEQILKEGLSIGENLGDEFATIGNLNGLAELALAQNNCEVADNYTKLVHKVEKARRFNRYFVNNLLNSAKVAFCKEQYNKVISLSKQVLIVGEKNRLLGPQQEARRMLVYSFEKEDDLVNAYHYLNQFDAIQDSIIRTKKVASAAELEAKYQFDEKEKEINFLEREKEISNSYINRLWAFLGIILMGIGYIFYLLVKKRKASKLINEKNEALNKYIASNLQLENFAYIASHDLRTPLLTIRSFVDLVRKSASDRLNKEEQKGLNFAAESSQDMINLVDDLMNFSTLNKSKLNKEKINFPDFVDYVLELNQPFIISKKARVKAEVNALYLNADRSKLLQLLQNLIQNAIKFHKKNEAPEVVIEGFTRKNEFVLSVKDNGIGIAPNFFEMIFLLFKRLHNKVNYEGTGIGLALCKKIVDMHGGKIWVESKVGEGSVFYCSFPK